MINEIFVVITLIFFLCIEIYLLGKRISFTNSLFINNESAIWLLGIIVYFGCTFLFFLPFIWFPFDIVYFIFIFIIKELIIFSYIFLCKERITFEQINYKNILYMMVISIGILFVFNFFIYKIENSRNELINFSNQFSQMWLKMQLVLSKITSISLEFINKWLIGFIGATVIYASINTIVLRFGKNQNIFAYSISGLISFGFIFIFNFNQNIVNLFGAYLALFSMFLALNILQFSRKRYSFVFIINFLVAWMINYRLFVALSAVAISTAIIYSWMQKPMASLFWVQLLTPIFIVLASWISGFSLLLTFGLMIIIFISYIALIFMGKNQILIRSNLFFNKYAKWFPYTNLLIILIIAILLIIFLPIDISNIINENNVVFDYNFIETTMNQKLVLKFTQWIIFGVTIVSLIFLLIYWKYQNMKLIGIRIMTFIILAIFIFAYNPIFNTILIAINIQNNFTYLRTVTFMPLILFAVITIHNLLINKKLIVS